jgi:hypothetical protein
MARIFRARVVTSNYIIIYYPNGKVLKIKRRYFKKRFGGRRKGGGTDGTGPKKNLTTILKSDS